MRAHIPSWYRWLHRSFCVFHPASAHLRVMVGLAFVLVAAILVRVPQPLLAQSTPVVCEWGKLVTSRNATVVRAQTVLQPGVLFATSGAFSEKPVDTSCDPGQELGPFPVDAGGTLLARLTGNPAVPNQWSLHNYGTNLRIVYEPLLGEEHYGPPQTFLEFNVPAEETAAEQGGSWPGPGRLRAYVGAPWGGGPLTYSCFDQAYTAEVEIVEVTTAIPAQPGMVLRDGDRLVTADDFSSALLAGVGSMAVGTGTEITFQSMSGAYPGMGGTSAHPPTTPDFTPLMQKADELSQAGYPMPKGYHANPNAFWRAYGDATLQEASSRTMTQTNACRAAVELKLFLESKQDIVSQPAARGYDWAVDNLSIWLLPNEFNELEALFKLASNPVPGLGVAANAKNLYHSVERTLVEVAAYAESQKAQQALDVFTSAVDLPAEEIIARRTFLDGEIADLIKRVRAGESDMREENARLQVDLKLFELGCMSTIPREGCEVLLQRYADGSRDAHFRFLEQTVPLTQRIATLAIERDTLKNYVEPLLDGNCDELKQQPPEPAPPGLAEQICRNREWKLILGKGLLHVYKEKHPWVEAVIFEIDRWLLTPDGTEFILEKQEDIAIVSVLEGSVELTEPNGEFALTLAAGEQVTLPDGEIVALVPEPVRRVGGIPLSESPLDSDIPEPAGVIELRATGGTLPPGWLWQEPNVNLDGPGDATLEIVDETTLRITVPNENELIAHRADAPRLLHKITGDFDLEADMLMEMEATHFAYSEFLIYTPDLPVGYLGSAHYLSWYKQMNLDAYSANYLIVGGGWARAEGLSKLGVVNGYLRDGVDAPETPVRVKFVRRGDLFKTYWSLDNGATWALSSRVILVVPQTLWVGWLFKRMAADGLGGESAITTLSDIRLTGAPLGTLPDDGWDLVWPNTPIDLGADLLMQQTGTEGGSLRAYSPWAIAGDFDLIVRFDAPPLTAQPGQERYIHIAVTSPNEGNQAYVRQAITADGQRMDADMSINDTWYRYHQTNSDATQDASRRVRLVREEDIVSGYFWQDDDWVLLGDWQDSFTGPLFLDFRFQWTSPTDDPQTAWFSVERLETEAGVFIETVSEADAVEPSTTGAEEPASGLPTVQSPPGPSPSGKQSGEELPGEEQPGEEQPGGLPLEPTPAPALTGAQRLEDNQVFDDFSSEALGWSVRANESATTGYAEGGYTILAKQPTYWVMSKVPGDFAPSVIEFDALVVPGAVGGMYGVICHYRNGDNYDFVAVDPEMLSVAAGRMQAGQFVFLSGDADGITEQPSDNLAREVNAVNRVRVACLDDRLELEVNGVPEDVWSLDPPAQGGNAALFVYGFQNLGTDGYTVRFDNVAAWRDAPSAVAIACEIAVDPGIAPQWDTARLGCPMAESLETWATVQAFERGLMIWRDDLPLIYTFADDNGWEVRVDEWYKGAELPSRGEPPAGLQAPVLSFGYVWALDDQVFDKLGWARWAESGLCATVQEFEQGFVIRRSDAAACGGRTNPGASAWFGSAEALHSGDWR